MTKERFIFVISVLFGLGGVGFFILSLYYKDLQAAPFDLRLTCFLFLTPKIFYEFFSVADNLERGVPLSFLRVIAFLVIFIYSSNQLFQEAPWYLSFIRLSIMALLWVWGERRIKKTKRAHQEAVFKTKTR